MISIRCGTYITVTFEILKIALRNLRHFVEVVGNLIFCISCRLLICCIFNSFTINDGTEAIIANGVFFSTKKCALYLKNAISCLFLKNVSPSKRVICFILNNLHFPMVEGIVFYALHKSRVLIIHCKADGFCLFIGLPDEI